MVEEWSHTEFDPNKRISESSWNIEYEATPKHIHSKKSDAQKEWEKAETNMIKMKLKPFFLSKDI